MSSLIWLEQRAIVLTHLPPNLYGFAMTNPFWQNIASLYTIEEPSKPVIRDYWYNLLLVYDRMFD